MVQWLKSDLEKAEARAAAAKQQVRAAKAALKRARKLFKTEKKAAKQARKKAKAALAAVRVAQKPRRVRKPRAAASRNPMRSAADVAKLVIDRLQSPPADLAPQPANPAEEKPAAS